LTIKAADRVVEARGDGGAEDTMAVGQLAEALSALAVPQDNFAIQGERFSSYVPAFESGAAHPGPDSLAGCVQAKHLEEVLHCPGDPIWSPDQDNIEPAAANTLSAGNTVMERKWAYLYVDVDLEMMP
jgi:hypothetical protein